MWNLSVRHNETKHSPRATQPHLVIHIDLRWTYKGIQTRCRLHFHTVHVLAEVRWSWKESSRPFYKITSTGATSVTQVKSPWWEEWSGREVFTVPLSTLASGTHVDYFPDLKQPNPYFSCRIKYSTRVYRAWDKREVPSPKYMYVLKDWHSTQFIVVFDRGNSLFEEVFGQPCSLGFWPRSLKNELSIIIVIEVSYLGTFLWFYLSVYNACLHTLGVAQNLAHDWFIK